MKLQLCCQIDFCSGNGKTSLQKDVVDDGSFSYYILNADSRTISLYIVLFTLVLPFVLYKYIDYLPQMINFLRRTNSNKEDVPLKKRVAYMVDVFFSIYPYAKLFALLFATLFLIAFGGLALYAVTGGSMAEALWHSWTYVADAGNHAETEGMGPRIVSVSISAGGMLIFAMMLGLVSDAISEKVDSLRKGKSEVIERNHVLILGWSDKLGSLLKQLAIANKSVGGGKSIRKIHNDDEHRQLEVQLICDQYRNGAVLHSHCNVLPSIHLKDLQLCFRRLLHNEMAVKLGLKLDEQRHILHQPVTSIMFLNLSVLRFVLFTFVQVGFAVCWS